MTPREAAAVLAGSGDAAVRLARSLPSDAARWRPGPNEWCVNECLGHLIEAESRGFGGRMRLILESDEPRLEAWDAAEIAAARDDRRREPSELAAELEKRRAESLELLSSVREADLQRGGVHPRIGRITVDELLHEWVHHDANHLRQALAAVEAYVWPAMGNTQTFSRE